MINQRPELCILIGKRAASPLLKRDRRPIRPPIERLHTIFQRRPEIDLTSFYNSIAITTTNDKVFDEHAIDPAKFKEAIHEVNK